MQYIHAIVIAQKDKPLQIFGLSQQESRAIIIPMSQWHVAANETKE